MARFEVLEGLAEGEQRRLLATAIRRKFAAGEVLFHQGDPGASFHMIDRGHVKISVLSPSGDSSTLAILGPGESFGEQALLTAEAERTATATALEPTQTMTIKASDFAELRARHPAVSEFLIGALAEQVRRLTEQVNEARFVAADVRVARQLRLLRGVYGTQPDGPVEIPLSQDEIAQLAGTTRPTVNRFLKSLGEGVELRRGKVIIVDASALPRD